MLNNINMTVSCHLTTNDSIYSLCPVTIITVLTRCRDHYLVYFLRLLLRPPWLTSVIANGMRFVIVDLP